MSVVLNSEEFIPTQREEIKKSIDEILDDFMEPLYVSIVVFEMKSIAAAANIPQGFIDGIKFVKTGKNKGELINVWEFAPYFEYGTTQHWIAPVTAKALAFPAKSGSHAQAIYFQGKKNPKGTNFSKGHYVSGIPRTEAMHRGYNLGKKLLAIEAGKIVQNELEYES